LALLVTLSAANPRNCRGEAVRQGWANASRSVGHSSEQSADDVAPLSSFTALSQS
jgi:hypothetical protein